MDTLLVVDDDKLIRWTIRQRMEDAGYRVVEAQDGAQARESFDAGADLVLLDYRLPDVDGLHLLRVFREQDPDVPVIMLTAHSSVPNAVEAMKSGAFHYSPKPFDLDELVLMVERALENTRLRREVRSLRGPAGTGFDAIIGDSPAMRSVKVLLAKVAASPSSTVLITGETGTGKDIVAKAVHRNSERGSGPFQNITCSALTATLLESELFGYERGAFTDAKRSKKGLLEMANQGTVFLDEIGEMEPAIQSKLLRFLEEKAFRRVGGTSDIRADVRVIAATNTDLKQAVRDGRFREDLYYRLAVLTVELPPLRDREGDLERLALHFADGFSTEFRKKVSGITPAAAKRLKRYHWPGNVRELRNVMERAVLLAEHAELSVNDFTMIPDDPQPEPGDAFVLPPKGIDIQELERHLVVQALERTGGNQRRAATLLGMNRDQIRYRIEKFNLDVKPDKDF